MQASLGQYAVAAGDARPGLQLIRKAAAQLPATAPATARAWLATLDAVALAHLGDTAALRMRVAVEWRPSRLVSFYVAGRPSGRRNWPSACPWAPCARDAGGCNVSLLVLVGTAVYSWSQTFPTNRLVRRLRRRPTLRSGGLAAALAAGYFAVAVLCVRVVESGGPGWLNLVVLLTCWNGLKLGASAILAIVRSLGRARGDRGGAPVVGDGVDAGAERGRGVSLPADVGGGR